MILSDFAKETNRIPAVAFSKIAVCGRLDSGTNCLAKLIRVWKLVRIVFSISISFKSAKDDKPGFSLFVCNSIFLVSSFGMLSSHMKSKMWTRVPEDPASKMTICRRMTVGDRRSSECRVDVGIIQ